MRLDEVSARDEVDGITEACARMGVGEEMTALILGSYRRDRALAPPLEGDAEDLRGYIRRKLAIWEDILDGPIR